MPRLAFDVDNEFSQEFNELVELTGANSKAEAFRKAISLYKVVTKAQKQGEKIMIADGDRQLISEIIIL
ncbi:MAG: DNA-binding protein [Cyanobacteria bacterium P01_G01_bin.49]